MKRHLLAMLSAFAILVLALPASAQKRYDPGATDTEIKIGNINPYSGPASAYGLIGRTIAAYFTKVNAEGGINGRKINFISYDDGYSPPKTRRAGAQAGRKRRSAADLPEPRHRAQHRDPALHERQEGAAAVRCDRRDQVRRSASTFPGPWAGSRTIRARRASTPSTCCEKHPNGKIGVLYQNDDYGKDYLKGLKDGLAGKMPIVSEQAYETTDPTVNSQIISLKGSRRRHLLQRRHAEVCRAGDPQGRRTRLAAGASAQQCVELGRFGVAARGLRERQGRAVDRTTSRTRPTRPGRTIPASRSGKPSWRNTFPMATAPRASRSTAMRWRIPWCRCSSRAATTSRART